MECACPYVDDHGVRRCLDNRWFVFHLMLEQLFGPDKKVLDSVR